MRRWKPAIIGIALALAGSGCTTIVRSSVASNGTGPNAPSRQRTPRSISDDGRYVVFESDASNLVPNDTNGATDVFRHDNQTGLTIRVSLGAPSAQISNSSTHLAISGNGDHVAFLTTAPLDAADNNGDGDIYVRSISSATTTWVSIRPGGGGPIIDSPEAGSLVDATMSDDGSRILMVQSAPGTGGIYIRDRTAGITAILGGGSGAIALLSGDGTSMVETVLCDTFPCPYRSFVIPVTLAAIPVEIDTQCGFRAYDVSSDARFVVGLRFGVSPTFTCPEPTGLVRWDQTTKAFLKVPIPSGLDPMTSISNDGRFVAANGQDLVVRVVDLATNVVQIPDANEWGQRGAGPSFAAALSGNGRYVAFTTNSKLVSGDGDVHDDVYTRYALQPGVSTVAPSSVARGAAHVVLTITGTELLAGLTATVAGTGVTVNSVTLQSPTQMKADISVAPTAPVGARNVVISNTGGFGHSDGLCAGCLTVT